MKAAHCRQFPSKVCSMANYESEVTQLIRDLLDKNPALKEEQKQNRATWWDKKQDLEQQKLNDQSEAPKQPYAYFPLPTVSESK